MEYDKAAYEREARKSRAIKRLALALDYEGPFTDRGVPKALGDFILERWKSDTSSSAHDKVERLLEAIRAAPEVAEREINRLYETDSELTMLERRTAYLLSIGFVPKQIAIFHGVSHDAIKERLRSARRKLEAENSTHMVAKAIRLELI
jgi:DNA-binding CsgD family transcriptional regulator